MPMILRRSVRPAFALACLLMSLSLLPQAGASPRPPEWLLLLPTDQAEGLVTKSGQENVDWCMFGEQTLLIGGPALVETWQKGPQTGSSWPIGPHQSLWLITSKIPDILHRPFPAFQVILRTHGFIVLLGTETDGMGLAPLGTDFTRVEPLPRNRVLLTPAWRGRTPPSDGDPVPELLKSLDMDAFWRDLTFFEGCKTRYSYVEQVLPAVAYTEQALRDLGLTVRRQPFPMAGMTRDNVEGVLPGSDPTAGEVIIVGHLDSTSRQPKTLAPGADDNGSGAAGVLALARFLTGLKVQPKATVRFVLFLGEEQGLVGSKAYVKQFSPEALKAIRTVLNMDMIGFDRKAPLSLLLETYDFVKPLAEEMAAATRTYTEMEPRISYHAWGSDHIPFLQQKVPCVLTIEDEFEDNTNYHQVTDTSDQINRDLCREILKLNAVILLRHGGCLDSASGQP